MFLSLLQWLDLVTVIRSIMMRRVLVFSVPDVVVFGSDLKEWILHPWLLRSLSSTWCLFQFWRWTLVHVKKLYSYYTMPWGMSDKKHVHKSPDWGMTKMCLLHSHLKTRSFLQLLLLFFSDVSEIDSLQDACCIGSTWRWLHVTSSSRVSSVTVLAFTFAFPGNMIP